MSKWEYERRLDYIDDRFTSMMTVRRADIIAEFGISVPQASSDIQNYLMLKPKVFYDKTNKHYAPRPDFKSVRGSTIERRTAWVVFRKSSQQERTSDV